MFCARPLAHEQPNDSCDSTDAQTEQVNYVIMWSSLTLCFYGHIICEMVKQYHQHHFLHRELEQDRSSEMAKTKICLGNTGKNQLSNTVNLPPSSMNQLIIQDHLESETPGQDVLFSFYCQPYREASSEIQRDKHRFNPLCTG